MDSTTSTAVKAAFLEQRRDGLVGVFKGLFQDAHTVVRRVLECCWTGIWCDPKVKRTAKISLFNEQTVQQVGLAFCSAMTLLMTLLMTLQGSPAI